MRSSLLSTPPSAHFSFVWEEMSNKWSRAALCSELHTPPLSSLCPGWLALTARDEHAATFTDSIMSLWLGAAMCRTVTASLTQSVYASSSPCVCVCGGGFVGFGRSRSTHFFLNWCIIKTPAISMTTMLDVAQQTSVGRSFCSDYSGIYAGLSRSALSESG